MTRTLDDLNRRRKHHLQKADANRARANHLDKLYRLCRAKVRFYEAQIRDRFQFVDSEKVALREEALSARNNALEEAKVAVERIILYPYDHGFDGVLAGAQTCRQAIDAIENLKTPPNPSPVRVRFVPKETKK